MKCISIIFLFVFIAGMSCKPNDFQIHLINAKGFDKENLRFKSLLFLNEKEGFIGGSSDEIGPGEGNRFATVKRHALLYKSSDGGKSWNLKEFGEGIVMKIIQSNNLLFAFVVREMNFHTSIFSSNDSGETWELNNEFPNVVSDLFQIGDKLVLIAKDSNNIFKMYTSKDNKISWQIKESLPVPMLDCTMDGNRFFYLSSHSFLDDKTDVLIKYNLTDDKVQRFDLPAKFDCYFLNKSNGAVTLVGLENNVVTCYLFDKNDTFKKEFAFKEETLLFPFGSFSSSSEEFIVVGKRNTSDVSYKVICYHKKENKFTEINFEKENYVQPFFFLNVKNHPMAWFYSGPSHFQILK